MFHHVLLRDGEDGERPLFVRLTDPNPPPPSEQLYRVLRTPVPHGGYFCFVTLDGERFCSVGPNHAHESADG